MQARPDEITEILITINALCNQCGYFRCIPEGDGYGCFHPLGDDNDNEGHCRTYGCPVAIEADIDDLKRLDNDLYNEYKGEARDDGGIESEWMVWYGETAQSYKDMLIKLKQSQAREQVLREALELLVAFDRGVEGTEHLDLWQVTQQARQALGQEDKPNGNN